MTFPNGYSKYQILTIDADQVSSTLSNFTIFIDLSIFDKSGADIFDTCRTDGGDIRVTLSDETTQLAREIVSIDTTARTGEMYIRVPSLSSVTDTDLLIWYNGTDTEPTEDSTYGKENTWASDYVMVQHMSQDPSETSPQIIDSTGNDNDLTSNGSMTSSDLVDGKLGKVLDFDGTDDYLSCSAGTYTTVGDDITFSAWINLSSSLIRPLIHYGNTGTLAGNWYLMIQNTNFNFYDRPDGGSLQTHTGTFPSDISDGDWHFVAFTRNSSTGCLVFYVDNEIQTATGQLGQLDDAQSSKDLVVGAARTYFYSQLMDEVKVSNTVKSSDWIATEYANQNSPLTFYNVSDEQILGEIYIIKLNSNVDEISKGIGPITTAQLGGLLIGG